MTRAQANLPALAVALLALTTAATVGFVVADGAYAGAVRSPDERRLATSLSERLVAADGPLTSRANVVDADALDRLNASRLRAAFPVVGEQSVRVTLDGETVAETGAVAGGTTVRRIVLVERRRAATLTAANRTLTIPRRTPRARVVVDPPPGTTVRTIRAGDRVVLHDASGLEGTHDIRLSRYETTTLRVDASGPLGPGSLAVTYFPATTTKAVLAVTVDA